MGFGAAKPPREIFLVRFGGEAAKTNQKLGFGAQPPHTPSPEAAFTTVLGPTAWRTCLAHWRIQQRSEVLIHLLHKCWGDAK
jgi:hypothetical protein